MIRSITFIIISMLWIRIRCIAYIYIIVIMIIRIRMRIIVTIGGVIVDNRGITKRAYIYFNVSMIRDEFFIGIIIIMINLFLIFTGISIIISLKINI
ncbi:hypothetical protein U3516DRAFT_910525 [Neocallimastix sp. 'constans']